MQDPQGGPGTRVAVRGGANGRPGIPLRPVNRSHLLRRESKFPFPMPQTNGNGVVRIRRARRVCESFSGIPSLSRRAQSD